MVHAALWESGRDLLYPHGPGYDACNVKALAEFYSKDRALRELNSEASFLDGPKSLRIPNLETTS